MEHKRLVHSKAVPGIPGAPIDGLLLAIPHVSGWEGGGDRAGRAAGHGARGGRSRRRAGALRWLAIDVEAV